MRKIQWCVALLMGAILGTAGGVMADKEYQRAIFGGGCFWCMEPPFEQLDGVVSVTAGYTGGEEKNPTYEQVSAGTTGHLEAVEVLFDPAVISYGELLEVFWRQIDPTDDGGQFADRGNHYRTAVFYASEEQRLAAEESKAALERSGVFSKPVKTRVIPAKPFYRAEEYHQDYYQKNVVHYLAYKEGSGRAGFLARTWKSEQESGKYQKPADGELRKQLTAIQYHVTQEDGTEPPFKNEYWDLKDEGIYVDIVSGEPLFSSQDKFDSGTGWPSFSKPLDDNNIVTKVDQSLFMVRVEVRSAHGDSHLGHVFEDGPPPTGLRYCINSAALRFIPADKLEEEGYGEYQHLFP